jgi:hypothetical protein
MIRRSSARMRVDDSGSAPDATATVCSGPASPVFFHRAKPVSRAGMLPSTTARSASGKYDGAGNDACRSAPHFNVTSLAPTRSSRYSVPHGAIGVFPYQAARGRLLEKFAVSRLTSVRLGFRRSRCTSLAEQFEGVTMGPSFVVAAIAILRPSSKVQRSFQNSQSVNSGTSSGIVKSAAMNWTTGWGDVGAR